MIVLPRPDRDPYFNRTPGADQAPPAVVLRELPEVGSDDEPTIVRDYRRRRQMIGLERSFRLTGKAGKVVTGLMVLVFVLVFQAFVSREMLHEAVEHPRTILRVPWSAELAVELAILLSFLCLSVGLSRGSRWVPWLMTVELIPAMWVALTIDDHPQVAGLIVASELLWLLMLWRPGGRHYFSQRYRELMEQTPAITVDPKTGRWMAALLLSALLVIHGTNHYLALWLLLRG